jgi:glycosyltransferase involved in cell wall biosynthesis
MKVFELPEINTLFVPSTFMRNNNIRPQNKKGLDRITKYIKSKKEPYTLFIWQYYTMNSNRWSSLKRSVEKILKECTGLRIVMCCNDTNSLEIVSNESISSFSAILCNHNATIDREIFNIQECNNIWNSVYTARVCKLKRHYLSYGLNNILYLTSGNKYNDKYSKEGHSALIDNQNNSFTLCSQHLTAFEVNDLLNKSKVGLCLSSQEGAMYSSVEYLLCGLPIVSTKSTGGRDVFFTDTNCIIAEDSIESVSSCVQQWLDNYPNLNERKRIREHTICIQKKHTNILKDKLKEISNNIDIDKLYKKKFINKMTISIEI